MPELATGQNINPVSYADALENYRKNTDWWIVFDALDLPNAIGSSLWLSGRTGISVEVVTEALEGLVVLGLVTKNQKGFVKIKETLVIPNNDLTKIKRMEDHATISRQVLNHLNEDTRGYIRFSSMPSNHQIIQEMYEKINQIIFEADAKSKSLPSDKIDNIYLTTFTSISSINYKEEKGATNA